MRTISTHTNVWGIAPIEIADTKTVSTVYNLIWGATKMWFALFMVRIVDITGLFWGTVASCVGTWIEMP